MKAAALLTLAILLTGCATVAPAPPNAVFVADLQSELLLPKRDVAYCDETFSQPGHPRKQEICVSNACGWSEAHLKVMEPVVGHVSRQVRLRGMIGEWCKPLFFDMRPMLVVTGMQDATTESVRYETYPLIDLGAEGFAFIPPGPDAESLLHAQMPPGSLDALLKPIAPRGFQLKERMAKETLSYWLSFPFVCEHGNEIAYCKAIFLKDFEKALRSRS